MIAALKALLLLGAALLCTAILVKHWLRGSRRLGVGLALLAALLLVAGSLLDIQQILARLPVNLDVWSYLTNTRHGLAVRWRLVVVTLLLVLMLLPVRRWQIALLLPGWLLLLFTFSYTSHAAAMGGSLALFTDWLHLAAAGVWTGVIMAVSLSGSPWRPGGARKLLQLMQVVSAVGLLSVLAIAVTGVVSSLFHLSEPDRFFGSAYSWALLAKIALVLVTVGVAAVNRFHFLPRLSVGLATGLRRNLIVEGGLLVAVFAATGLLSTSSLPHGQEFPGLVENLSRMIEFLRR